MLNFIILLIVYQVIAFIILGINEKYYDSESQNKIAIIFSIGLLGIFWQACLL